MGQENSSARGSRVGNEFFDRFCKEEVEYHETLVKKYEELNTVMIFGSLLSAVTTAFIAMIENTIFRNHDNFTFTHRMSPPHARMSPPLAIYCILFASLFSSLLAALLAMLAQQWPKRHTLVGMRRSAIERNGIQHRKLNCIVTWCFVCLIDFLQPMLWGSLFLLECSLFLWPWIDTTTTSVVNGATSLCATLHFVATASIYVTLHYTAGRLGQKWIGRKHVARFNQPGGWSVNESSHEISAPLDESLNPDPLECSPHGHILSTNFEDLDSSYMPMDTGRRSWNPSDGGDVFSVRPTPQTMPNSLSAGATANAPSLGLTDSALGQQSTSEVHGLGLQDNDDPRVATPAWRRLISQPLPTAERVSLIADIFSDHIQADMVNLLRGGDAQTFIDVIDETSDALSPSLQEKCLGALRKICGRSGFLPTSIKIQVRYDRADVPLFRGGHADIWMGQHRGHPVAVKKLNGYATGNFEEITKRLCKEVLTWKSLRHPNVLPLLGVISGDHPFAIVSEWMTGGNINEFVRANRGVNRFELLKDVAAGLMYMHGQAMIHGDLKGANVLIDESGRARIADFGILTILSDRSLNTCSSSAFDAGNVRWMSPELLHPEHFDCKDSRPTKASDCYALGMVVWEVLSGRAPYSELTQIVIIWSVIKGKRPERPEGQWFTDDLWRTLERCWSPQPKDRLAIEAVLDCLGRAATEWSLSPGVENDDETAADEKVRTV